MSRRKGEKNAGNIGQGAVSSGGDFSWVNVSLGAELEATCAELAADISRLAHGFVGLTGDGLDISLKRGDRGEFMACAYGHHADGRRLGLSSWGSTPEDAIAGLIVKWLVVLDRSFEGASSATERPRFR